MPTAHLLKGFYIGISLGNPYKQSVSQRALLMPNRKRTLQSIAANGDRMISSKARMPKHLSARKSSLGKESPQRGKYPLHEKLLLILILEFCEFREFHDLIGIFDIIAIPKQRLRLVQANPTLTTGVGN
jgi:hypothetical protein